MRMPRWISVLTTAVLLSALMSAIPPAGAQDVPQEALSLDTMRKRALELVNEARKAEKLPPLALEAKLNAAAQGHAADMLKRNFYAHNSPEGKTPADRYQKQGGSKWMLTAENIAQCMLCDPPVTEADLRRLQEGWMTSPGHRANILRKGLTTFGYGIVVDAVGGLYAVQNFAGPGTSGDATGDAANAPETDKALSAGRQGELALAAINQERRKAGRAPVKLSQSLTVLARALAPPKSVATFGQQRPPDLFTLIPEAERKSWGELAMVAAICGGCGQQPTAADISSFAGQWFRDARYSQMLLDPAVTHIGFTLAADGAGKKVGLSLLGKGL